MNNLTPRNNLTPKVPNMVKNEINVIFEKILKIFVTLQE